MMLFTEKNSQPITKQRNSFFFLYIYNNFISFVLAFRHETRSQPTRTQYVIIKYCLHIIFPSSIRHYEKSFAPTTKHKGKTNTNDEKIRLDRCFVGTYGNTVWVFSSDLITFGTSLLEWVLFLVLELHFWFNLYEVELCVVQCLLNCSRRIF